MLTAAVARRGLVRRREPEPVYLSRLRFPYRDAVAVAFNATGRDFEIAIATDVIPQYGCTHHPDREFAPARQAERFSPQPFHATR